MPADKDVIVITDDDVEDNIKTGKRSKLNSGIIMTILTFDGA